ncbi:MAG: DNA-binding protein WhiA [bacterium]|jgi:DNA-binding protein WhiA|nr:DNA-binding protein WhiA [Bacillota bacterium]
MYKTFSFKVKDELSRLQPGKLCCLQSELLGFLRAGAVLEAGQSGIQVIATTESPSVARRVFLLLKHTSALNVKISREPRRMQHHNLYSVRLPTQPGLKEFLIRLGFLRSGTGADKTVIPPADCCRRSYLRGFFLGSGSLSNPERFYHLELVTGSRRSAAHLIRLLLGFNLRARRVERKDRQVVYLKDGDDIAAFLTLIGAVTSRLELENIRVVKGVRNQVNRLVNCETANLSKTVEAACRQLAAIRCLVDNVGLENLPRPLREVARLRLEHPEATLKELGAQLDPPLGKSGVNHRLRRLEQMAADFKIE